MKAKIFGLPMVLAVLVVASGCGGSEQECPSGSVYSEGPNKGQCAGKQAVESSEAHEKHAKEVESEEHEAESVIKQRKAEETANAVESIEGGK